MTHINATFMILLLSIIIIASLSAALLILAGIYRKFFKDNLENTSSGQDAGSGLLTPFTVSVADYVEKTQLPVVEFTCNGKKLLFILDSGSNGCHINRSALEELGVETYREEPKDGTAFLVATGNGVTASATEKCELVFSLADYEFYVEFNVDDLDASFDFMFANDGVRVHGILGTNFLRASNWTIDFANKVAYPAFKKK